MRDTTHLGLLGVYPRQGEGSYGAQGIIQVSTYWSFYGRQDAPNATQVTISRAELPRQGVETYDLVFKGGPFPYDKDGSVFGNRERLLPLFKRGYYREYTVKTPSTRNRGARRIVCGGPVMQPETCYYTADHYASFRKIVP
jgi:ribonuclease T1